jgi:hypothetical protein
MSLSRFALYFLPENLRPPPNSKVCARDAHSNLVFLHFPRLSDLSLFFSALATVMGNSERFGRKGVAVNVTFRLVIWQIIITHLRRVPGYRYLTCPHACPSNGNIAMIAPYIRVKGVEPTDEADLLAKSAMPSSIKVTLGTVDESPFQGSNPDQAPTAL